MSKRNYIIMHGGQFLEAESLYDIRAATDEEEWTEIMIHTIDSYCYMKSLDNAYSADGGIDKNDRRIMRLLKRSISLFKRMDAVEMAKYNLDEIISKYDEIVGTHMKSFNKTINVACNEKTQGPDIDIYTNNLNISSL